MGGHTLILVFLLVFSKSTQSKVHYYVTPSPAIPCPQEPCITLSQFAANSSSYGGNISLLVLPGHHSLDEALVLSHIGHFSMESQNHEQAVVISCVIQTARITINETTIASIKGLHFVGCGGNTVTTVEELTVEDTIFQGVEGDGRGTALILNEVKLTQIINCSFISNTPGLDSERHYAGEYITNLDLLFVNDLEEDDLVSVGGALFATSSNVSVTKSKFTLNEADFGGVLFAYQSIITITHCTYSNNSGGLGGVMHTYDGSFSITSSTFSTNFASRGGVLHAINGSFNVASSSFTNNVANSHGGVMHTSGTSFIITDATFINNFVGTYGGVMHTLDGSVNIINTTFTSNTATYGGVMNAINGSFNITSSSFANNNAKIFGGVMCTSNGSFSVTSSTFSTNIAKGCGGVMSTFGGSFSITTSTYTNTVAWFGVVMCTNGASYDITGSAFTRNQAGVINFQGGSLNIINSSFDNNRASSIGGIVLIARCSARVVDSTFRYNSGSFFTYGGSITFSGQTKFENCFTVSQYTLGEGGALTSFQSTVNFYGETSFLNNQARQGGAILATDSRITFHGTTTIANNVAFSDSGGGVSLQKSVLDINGGRCVISYNYAKRGGGVHAKSSTINIHQSSTLYLMYNGAENGSGLYLEVNPTLYLLKDAPEDSTRYLIFSGNSANYGGAVHVADDTNYGACSLHSECFIQTLLLYENYYATDQHLANIQFSGNTATERGPNLYGGLLDRCRPSQFAEVYIKMPNLREQYYNGVNYLQTLSNITLNSIASRPVRVCFCNSESEPDCSHQPSTTEVKKGETFKVSLVAVDQVNRSVEANILSSLASLDGGFSEGQQTQSVGRNCTDLTFNVFSPHDSETLNIFADGPCGSSAPSIRHLSIHFLNCSCPVGFQPSHNESTNCVCICDSRLRPYITTCDYKTDSIIRENTNSWITYINDTDQPGYVIHPNCPYDYCQPQTVNVSIDLNLPNGADTQCAFNRTGILCGACQEHLSLSLGSSRCLPCPSHWSAVFVVILLAAIIAGILLVTALLTFNMTVAVGLINGFIFYANIVAANSAVFFPSSEPSFPTVIVAWLNLDLGIDVCFFDGLDTYTKTLLQLAFPVYIISLVVIVIIVSEYSPRFAALIGRRDPIATLATLILLSYSKLLSIIITVLSPAVINYPDGSQETVWLPDGNVKYFEGKHIVLVMFIVIIVLVGAPYTILLFLWQWIVRVPIRLKVFNWTRNTKLNAFIAAYHAPHTSKHRYWTGLLLLVRVVLYIISSITVSSNPQALILTTAFFIGALTLQKSISNIKVYDKTATETIDTILCYNLLTIALFSLYHFKTDSTKQTAIAYTSTIVTFLLFIGIVVYHITVIIRTDRKKEEHQATSPGEDAIALLPQQGVTYSVVDITKEDEGPSSSEANADPPVLAAETTAM